MIDPDFNKPRAWMSLESLNRLRFHGGNKSRGTVPVHAERSSVSCIPLYAYANPFVPNELERMTPVEIQEAINRLQLELAGRIV